MNTNEILKDRICLHTPTTHLIFSERNDKNDYTRWYKRN